MPLYMLQATYTPEAWAALAKNPTNRSEAISALLSKAGGRLISLYNCFGEYDAVVIIDMPDDTAAAAVSIAAQAAGHLKMAKTTRMFTAEEGVEAMRKAGGLTLQTPLSQ